MVVRPVRQANRPSRFAGAVFFIATVTVGSIVEILLFVAPAPPKDLAVAAVVAMIVNSICLGVALLWDRGRRRRRRYRGG